MESFDFLFLRNLPTFKADLRPAAGEHDNCALWHPGICFLSGDADKIDNYVSVTQASDILELLMSYSEVATDWITASVSASVISLAPRFRFVTIPSTKCIKTGASALFEAQSSRQDFAEPGIHLMNPPDSPMVSSVSWIMQQQEADLGLLRRDHVSFLNLSNFLCSLLLRSKHSDSSFVILS